MKRRESGNLVRLIHAHVLGVLSLSAVFAMSASAGTGPVVQFEQTTHDFGSVYEPALYTATLKYHNQGSADLVFNNIKRSCFCVYEIDSGYTLKPGATGSLKVGFNLHDQKWGVHNQTIAIETNDINQPNVTISIRIDYQPPVAAIPNSIELSPDSIDAPLDFRIQRYRDAIDPSSPLRFDTPAGPLSIEPISVEQDGVLDIHRFRLHYNAASQSDMRPIVVRTGVSALPVLEIPVSYVAQSALSFDPGNVLFGVIKVNETKSRQIKISGVDPRSGGLIAKCDDRRVSIHMEQSAAGTAERAAQITFAANEVTGRFRTTIHFYDGDANPIGLLTVLGLVVR